MKKFLAVIGSLAALTASVSAFAYDRTGVAYDVLSETGKTTASLDRCGGTAELERNRAGSLVLHVRNATCSNLVTQKGSWKLKGDGANNRYADIAIDETVAGWHDILIGSNAFVESMGLDGNGDIISIYIPKRAAMPVAKISYGSDRSNVVALDDCMGTMQAKIVSGLLQITFNGLEKCSKYDLVSVNGRDIGFAAQEMFGDKGAIFVPAREITSGKNVIEVRFYKPGAREDGVKVVAYAR